MFIQDWRFSIQDLEFFIPLKGLIDISKEINRFQVSSQRYITDEEGNILMFVNVWGHVNSPGSHLVYDGIDLASVFVCHGIAPAMEMTFFVVG